MTLTNYVLFSALFLLSCQTDSAPSVNYNQVQEKAKEALTFCTEHAMNEEFCILIDMSLHSGIKRFYLWDFKSDCILDKGLCSHGCCQNPWGDDKSKTTPVFSNIPDSHCSALGKFKIGNRGPSSWGIKVNYKLHGLEPTNDKAFSRFIVLHSWEMVSEKECHPAGTPEGWGCPAISNELMTRLDKRLQKADKPVLKWIYI